MLVAKGPQAFQKFRCRRIDPSLPLDRLHKDRDGLRCDRPLDGGQTELDLAPLACPAGTPTASFCPSAWPQVAGQLGIDAGVEAGADASAGGG